MRKLWITLFALVAWNNALFAFDEISNEDQHPHEGGSNSPQLNRTVTEKQMALKEDTNEEWKLSIDPFVASRAGWYATKETQNHLARLVHENDPVAAYYLGKVFFNLGDEDDSQKCNVIARQGFLRIIHDSISSSFHKALAFWYLSLLNDSEGSKIKASSTLQEMQESKKTSSIFLLWDAYLALMNKDYQASIDSLKKVEKENPRAFLYEADVYIRQGRYADAVAPCLEALKHNILEAYAVLYELISYDRRIFVTVASKLKENSLGEFNTPEELLEKANTAKSYEKLASIAFQQRDLETAAGNYVKSAEAGLPQYFQQAADLYRALGNTDLALRYEKSIGPFSERFNREPYIRQLAGIAFEPS